MREWRSAARACETSWSRARIGERKRVKSILGTPMHESTWAEFLRALPAQVGRPGFAHEAVDGMRIRS